MTTHLRRARGRPSGGESVVSRELLLDAAERIIARCGAGVSIEAIAVEAGVSKPVVYAHVGDRTALADALAARLTDRLVAASTDAVNALGRDGSQHDALTVLIEAALRTISGERELFLYVTRGASSTTTTGVLFLAERSARPLAELLARWLTGQGRNPELALPWAYGVIGMLNLVALWWTQDPDRPAEVLADQLAELMWSGLSGS